MDLNIFRPSVSLGEVIGEVQIPDLSGVGPSVKADCRSCREKVYRVVLRVDEVPNKVFCLFDEGVHKGEHPIIGRESRTELVHPTVVCAVKVLKLSRVPIG